MMSAERQKAREDPVGSIKTSIIIPAHNEAERIQIPLEECAKHFQAKQENFEILVVTNNCWDGTEKVVEEIANRYPQIRQVVIHERIGKGGAIIEGIRRVRGAIVAFVDADGSTPAAGLDHLVAQVGPSDGVIGSRWIEGAIVPIRQKLLRRMLSRGFNLLVRLLFGVPFRDTQCGAKAFTYRSLMTVVDDLKITDYAFDVNLLYLLRQRGFVVREVPIRWYDREGSQLKLSQVVPRMFTAVIQLRVKNSRLGRLFR